MGRLLRDGDKKVDSLTKHEEMVFKANEPEDIFKRLTKDAADWKKMDEGSSVTFINQNKKESSYHLQNDCLGGDAFWKIEKIEISPLIIEEV